MTITTPKQTLEDSIKEVVLNNSNGLSYEISDMDSFMIDIKALFKQIVEDKVIKKDQKQVNLYHIAEYREIQAQNNLRDDQRQALEDIISGKEKI